MHGRVTSLLLCQRTRTVIPSSAMLALMFEQPGFGMRGGEDQARADPVIAARAAMKNLGRFQGDSAILGELRWPYLEQNRRQRFPARVGVPVGANKELSAGAHWSGNRYNYSYAN
jgi:hypothetical protein